MKIGTFEKLLVLKDIVDKNLAPLLTREGYSLRDAVFSNLNSHEYAEPITEKPSISVIYANEDSAREIEVEVDINYLPYITISNVELDESFDFHDYYKYKFHKPFEFDDLSGNDQGRKFESFFQLINKEFTTNLLKLIRGKEWQDIPEDWGPYK
jgi:hypothetical protein